MKKIKKILFFLFFCFLSLTAFGEELLISQTTSDDDQIVGDYSNTEYRRAQSFTLAAETTITRAEILFSSNINSPSGTIDVRVETLSGGDPSGTLAHANGTKALTVTPSDWNEVDWTDFSLSADSYCIALRCDDQSTTNGWQVRISLTDEYAGGNFEDSNDGGSTWSAQANRDLVFKLYGIVAGVEQVIINMM